MLKKIFFTVVALVLLACLSLIYITRDNAATHVALRDGNMPPLIPTYEFYANPRVAYGYAVSSGGTWVTHLQSGLKGLKRVVRKIDSSQLLAEFPSDAGHVRWHPVEPRLRFIWQGHDWEMDIFNPERENWKRISPVKLSGGWVKNSISTSADDREIVWGKSHPRETAHIWLVSQDGLDAEKVGEGNEDTAFWIFNEKKEPVVRVDSLGDDKRRYFFKSNKNWETLFDVSINDTFWPISDVHSDNTVLMISSRNRDKAALVSFNLETKTEAVVFSNPEADVGNPVYLTHHKIPDLIQQGGLSLEYHALTKTGEVFLQVLSEFEQPVSLGYIAPTASGRYVSVALSPGGKSFVYVLIDLQSGEWQELGEYYFRRYRDQLAKPLEVSFTARDGMQIPAVLTRASDLSVPTPFVVHIHGGPAGYVSREYEHFNQFLVNRGYGVLSVNFRGSTGFGKAFQAAGFRQFGRDMQNDITDAANWLVEKRYADPDALVAMGASYGGYSAALAMTQEPGLFDAAVVEIPMLDPEFQSKYHPGFWKEIGGWHRYFGDIENDDDLAMMREYSLLQRVDELHGPVLILAGLRDQVTAVQQVRDFEAAAKSAARDVTVHYFPEAGHGFRRWQDMFRRARLIEDFLAEHIGGRSGGYDVVEPLIRFVQ
jgi:dipeptidyl aminopeptidase/acylaminoacyl peptidase